MKIQTTPDGTTQFELTAEEIVAINEAMLIVEQRSKEEGGCYDKQMLEWRLYGLLRENGTEKMIKWAKEAPFREKSPSVREKY